MKKFIVATAALFALSTSALAQDTYINGYYKNNGTYVQPHYQTAPDNSVYNNYSTQGNINPYTGQSGTISPYAAQQHNRGGYYNNGYNR